MVQSRLHRLEQDMGRLLSSLAGSRSEAHDAVGRVLVADRDLRAATTVLKEHQAKAQELSELRLEIKTRQQRIRSYARGIVEAEGKLRATITAAEALLSSSKAKQPLSPAEILAYARTIAHTTAAPPEYRQGMELGGRILPPAPIPIGSGTTANVPSMEHVSWIHLPETVEHSEGQDGPAAPGKAKTKGSQGAAAKQSTRIATEASTSGVTSAPASVLPPGPPPSGPSSAEALPPEMEGPISSLQLPGMATDLKSAEAGSATPANLPQPSPLAPAPASQGSQPLQASLSTSIPPTEVPAMAPAASLVKRPPDSGSSDQMASDEIPQRPRKIARPQPKKTISLDIEDSDDDSD